MSFGRSTHALMALVVAALLLPATAGAEGPALGWSLPASGAGAIGRAQTSDTLHHLGWRVGLGLDLADDLLVGQRSDGALYRPLAWRSAAWIAVALGLWDRVELGVALPVSLWQRARDEALPSGEEDSRGLGDLAVDLKARLLGSPSRPGLGLAAAIRLTAPTAMGARFAGDELPTVTPWLIGSWRFEQGATLALDLGYRLRSAVEVDGTVFDDEVRLGLGAELPLGAHGLSALTEVDADLGVGTTEDGARRFVADTSPVEAMGGLRWRRGRWSVTVGAAKGLSSGYGAPDMRFLTAVAYQTPRAQAGPTPRALAAPPVCRSPAPPPGLSATGGRAPSTTAPPSPAWIEALVDMDPDPDADGLVGPADGCPREPEDLDDFEDADGCPDLDDDRDGVPDLDDRCPREPETVNGVMDEDGCPDEGAGVVVVGGERIELGERVLFETASDQLDQRSEKLLKQVAAVLKANPQVLRVRVEGHTDDRGHPDMNVDLAERRARRVRQALISAGIEAARLEARGMGATRPLTGNGSEEGRARNRRVELHVLDVAGQEGAP